MDKQKKFKLRKNTSIGSPDAETDEILFEVFVPIYNLSEIMDTKSQKSILIGRTGTGKSAIIKYLKEKCEYVTEISPEAMSLRFLSRSTILSYFKQLGVNLNLFYKVLWKHVFIVELLKLYFDDDLNSQSNKLIFLNIIDGIRKKISRKNPQKERALKYLENWTHDFWQETEYRIKSFESTVQTSFAASMGLSIEDISSAKLDSSQQSKENFIIEAKSKAEEIINNSQAKDLLEIIQIMKNDLFNSHQKKFYLIIDDLDKEWVEDELRYELIGAMVEVIKELRQFCGVKIIISLRENLNELVFSGLKNKGGQREKFKPLYSSIEWSEDDLHELLNKRLKKLSDYQLDIKNAFYISRRKQKSGIDYVLERTYKRPRDVISYVNHAIENANNKTSFSKDVLAKAEPMYSLERFHALEDEWSENYGQLSLITHFLRGVNDGFRLKSIKEDQFEEIYFEEKPENDFNGDLLKAILDWKDEKINFISFLKKVIFMLYRIGILGIKKGPTYQTAFYYDRNVLIDKNDVSNNSRFYVHPALYSFFKVNVLDQLPENYS